MRKVPLRALTAVAVATCVGAGSVVVAQSATADQIPPARSVPVNGDVGDSPQDLAGGDWLAPPQKGTAGRANLAVDPWPSAASEIQRLKFYGLNPILETGYNDPIYEANANYVGSTSTVQAVMMHDTGTSVPASRLKVEHSLPWILTGVKSSAGKTVRACHFYVDRLGRPHVVYLGRTWHAGAGDVMFGVAEDRMNSYSMGIEIESEGGGVQDLTGAQIDTASRIAAAALDVANLPTSRAINHKDYAGRKQGKVDSAYNISWWRAKIDAIRLVSLPIPTPTPTAISKPTPNPTATPTAKPSPTVTPITPKPMNPRWVSLSAMRLGKKSIYVARYQKALRAFGKARGVAVARYNPAGATGLYRSQTRALTRAVLIKLKSKSSTWKRYWATHSHNYPATPLIKKLKLIPIR